MKAIGGQAVPLNDTILKQLIGEWKTVKIEEMKATRFDYSIRDSISNSILVIENNSVYLKDTIKQYLTSVPRADKDSFYVKDTIKLFELLEIFTWVTPPRYDRLNYLDLEIFYLWLSDEEFTKMTKKMLMFYPGESGEDKWKPHDLSPFYLKGDTLISFCGGYYFYRLKIDSNKNIKNN